VESVLQILFSNLRQTTYLEYIAVVFGIISPLFSRKENILVYPTGIISVTIYVYLCYKQQIYAEMGINAFYLIMSFYGWYKWKHPQTEFSQKPITKLSFKEILYNLVFTFIYFVVLYFILKNYTNSTVPIFDSLATSIFITGMWLMAIKKIENWYAWILGNLIAIPLYAYKDLVLTSILYFVLMIIAIFGLLSWQNKLNLKV
jgi:nicotinamide mononucleotide transporter